MSARLVSVIVCTRNRCEVLPRVINQLGTQDYPQDSYEIIIVDNCSTDQTPHVAQHLITKLAVTVRYVLENRLGISFARNSGAEEAHYPYLAYLDDDCTVGSDWLSQLVQGFDLNEMVAIVGGKVVIDWDLLEKPIWLGIELERWLGEYSHSSTQPIIVENNARVREGNMVVKRESWESSKGFLGMEQFGSKHMAAAEVIYMLNQIDRQGGKVAYVPSAVVYHHIGMRDWRWMLRRAYWQGVSDGILDYLLYKRPGFSIAVRVVLDVAAMIVFLGFSCFSFLRLDQAKGMYHLMRAIRRFSLALSQMRILGNWHCVHSWASTHQTGR